MIEEGYEDSNLKEERSEWPSGIKTRIIRARSDAEYLATNINLDDIKDNTIVQTIQMMLQHYQKF